MNNRKLISLTLTFASLSFATGAVHALEEIHPEWQQVMAPMAMSQGLRDTDAAVTLIKGDTLRALGITSIPEALRLVPGFVVDKTTGRDHWRISYHGTQVQPARRLQVKVDGISVYRDDGSRVDWDSIPVTIQDVRSIEVVRAPAAASEGDNSVEATVHIQTTLGEFVDDRVTVSVGDRVRQVHAQSQFALGLNGILDLRGWRHEDLGYDYTEQTTDNDGSDNATAEGALASFAWSQQDLSLSARLAYVTLDQDTDFIINSQQISDAPVQSYDWHFASGAQYRINTDSMVELDYAVRRMTHQQRWRSAVYAGQMLESLYQLGRVQPEWAAAIAFGQLPSDPAAFSDPLVLAVLGDLQELGPAAYELLVGDVNMDIDSLSQQVEFRHIWSPLPELRLSSGFGAKSTEVDSATFFNGQKSASMAHVFTNAEYKLDRRWTFNAGLRVSEETRQDTAFNPRFSVNHHVGRHTIKLAYSEGQRAPDFYETSSDWHYTVYNLNKPILGQTDGEYFRTAFGNMSQTPERYASTDVTFMGTIVDGFQYELKLFNERKRDLLSDKISFFDGIPTNDGWSDVEGMDLVLRYTTGSLELVANYSGFQTTSNKPDEMNYAVDSFDADAGLYRRKAHITSIYGVYRLPRDYVLGVSASARNDVGGSSQELFSVNLGKDLSNRVNVGLAANWGAEQVLFNTSSRNTAAFYYDQPWSLVAKAALTF